MLKVACIAAILAVASPRPQGDFGNISYQFPYSSQSIKLHTDDDEDHDHIHQEIDDLHHHLEVYHPIQDKHEIDEEHPIEPPKVQEKTMEMPIMYHKKHIEMPKKDNEKHFEFPKNLHEKLPMSMMMMYNENEMPKYYEDKKMRHEIPKKHEEYSNKEEYHAKHHESQEEKHAEKHEEHHKKHHHEEHNHPKYQYDYTVRDPHTGDYKTHHESRHGDLVHGFYTIHEADGTTRIVEYSADQTDGFKATVRHEGQPTHVP